MTYIELKEKQKNLYETAKNFLDSHVDKDGNISAEDKATHDKMLKDFDALTETVKLFERQEELDKKYASPTAKK